MKNYHVNIFYSEEDEGFIADIPDLEFCSAFGKTRKEALKQIEIALTAWLEAAKAEGIPIPKPKYRPAIYQINGGSIVKEERKRKVKETSK